MTDTDPNDDTDRGHFIDNDDSEDADEVATKPELWRPLADAMDGFDLDPASGAEPVPIAIDRYTEADDGLTSPWYGTVFLNPPFSDKYPWYERLATHYQAGDIDAAVAIATHDFSADWYQDHFSTADVIGRLNGRDWFTAPGSSPTFATQVGIWNPTPDAIDTLRAKGTVETPLPPNTDPTTITDFSDL